MRRGAGCSSWSRVESRAYTGLANSPVRARIRPVQFDEDAGEAHGRPICSCSIAPPRPPSACSSSRACVAASSAAPAARRPDAIDRGPRERARRLAQRRRRRLRAARRRGLPRDARRARRRASPRSSATAPARAPARRAPERRMARPHDDSPAPPGRASTSGRTSLDLAVRHSRVACGVATGGSARGAVRLAAPRSGSPDFARRSPTTCGRRAACVCAADDIVVTAGTARPRARGIRARPGSRAPGRGRAPGLSHGTAHRRTPRCAHRRVPVDADGIVDRAPASDVAARRCRHGHAEPPVPARRTTAGRHRLALLDWARDADALVLEDDYDSEFRHLGRRCPHSRRSTTGAGRLVGSFSKVLTPCAATRLPRAAAEPELRAAIAALRVDEQCPVPGVAQEAAAALLASGAVRRHIAVTSRDYAHRRRLVLEALARLPGARLSGLDGGLHAVIELDPGPDIRRRGRTPRGATAWRSPASPTTPPWPAIGAGASCSDTPARRHPCSPSHSPGIRGRSRLVGAGRYDSADRCARIARRCDEGRPEPMNETVRSRHGVRGRSSFLGRRHRRGVVDLRPRHPAPRQGHPRSSARRSSCSPPSLPRACSRSCPAPWDQGERAKALKGIGYPTSPTFSAEGIQQPGEPAVTAFQAERDGLRVRGSLKSLGGDQWEVEEIEVEAP